MSDSNIRDPRLVAELEALRARPADQIDFSDIPEISDEAWTTRRPLRGTAPTEAVTVQLDPVIAEWLRSDASRSATGKINRILRGHMIREANRVRHRREASA